MNKYSIYCTKEQTLKALELGAPINKAVGMTDIVKEKYFADGKGNFIILPTAEQMIGFILESGRGYSTDFSDLIREQGYKQGCLTFIDSCLK